MDTVQTLQDRRLSDGEKIQQGQKDPKNNKNNINCNLYQVFNVLRVVSNAQR